MSLAIRTTPIQSLRALLARLHRRLRSSAATRRRRSYYRRLIGV